MSDPMHTEDQYNGDRSTRGTAEDIVDTILNTMESSIATFDEIGADLIEELVVSVERRL